MRPINSPTQLATAARPAAESANACQAAPVSTIPAIHFNHYPVLGDGDCLFRAMYMGLFNQPGVEPSQDQVMGLRQYLANYVYQHQDALAHNPAFEGRQGVLNLYDLLLTPGQWNHNAGDLVAPLLAQVSGRPLAVLQATQEGGQYHVRQVFPAENSTLPVGTAHTGEPAICLAHINGNHYGLLEERYPNVLLNALSQLSNTSQVEHGAEMSIPRERTTTAMDVSNPSHIRKGGKGLSDRQKHELAQLWQANPSWGDRKLAREFMQRKPGEYVSKWMLKQLRDNYPDLQQLDLGSTMRKKKLSEAQEAKVAQIWRENPKWGYQKVATEFNKRNPGANITLASVRSAKASYPGLQGLKLGAQKVERKLNDAQEDELVKIWQANPSWGYTRVKNAFNKLHPELTISPDVVRGVKSKHPSLQSMRTALKNPEKEVREQEMIKLWRNNPSWGERKIAHEFTKRNPGVSATKSLSRLLKKRCQALRDLDLGSTMKKKKLSDGQERELLQLQRDNPLWSESKIAQEFMHRYPEVSISKSLFYRAKLRYQNSMEKSLMQPINRIPDIPEEDVLSPRTLATLGDLFIDEPDHRSQSQETFSVLGNTADVDGLPDGQDSLGDHSDDGSQGTFDGLEDFEDVSSLKD